MTCAECDYTNIGGSVENVIDCGLSLSLDREEGVVCGRGNLSISTFLEALDPSSNTALLVFFAGMQSGPLVVSREQVVVPIK